MAKYYFFTILFLVTTGVFSQESVELKDILSGHVENMGGESLLKKLETVKSEHTLYSNNLEFPQLTTIILNKGLYQETLFPGSKMIVSLLDGKGWQINPYITNDIINLTDQEVGIYSVATRFLSPLYDYEVNKDETNVESIKLIGNQKIENDECYILEILYKTKYTEKIYVSKDNLLVRKIENTLGSTVFDDYKEVDGIMVAHNCFIKNSMGTIESDLITIKINPKVDVKDFDKP